MAVHAVTVIDADRLVMGRLSTHVAKRLLNGEEVVVVNADKALIAGSRDAIIDEFQARRKRGSQRKGPYYPKMPDRILRRSVRGMLPYRKSRGKNALHNLKVYTGIPKEHADSKPVTVPEAKKPDLYDYMELGVLSKILGAEF